MLAAGYRRSGFAFKGISLHPPAWGHDEAEPSACFTLLGLGNRSCVFTILCPTGTGASLMLANPILAHILAAEPWGIPAKTRLTCVPHKDKRRAGERKREEPSGAGWGPWCGATVPHFCLPCNLKVRGALGPLSGIGAPHGVGE